MRTSDSLDLLAAALVKAQAEIKVAKRDSENPFFKSKYADLEAVHEACHEALQKNGLAVIQVLSDDSPDFINLQTRLIHTSGQWVEGSLPLKPSKQDPQGMGSAITYARRYSLAAMVGVVVQGEDDDGNHASTSPSRGRQAAPRGPTRQGIAKAAPGWAEEPPPITEDRPERPPDPYGATDPQKKMIWKLITDRGLTTTKGEDAIGGHTILHWGGQTIILNDLTKREASELIEEILNAPK